MGDKKITVFIFKSSVQGFDVTLESWYGGAELVPLFLYPKDWVSDFLVTVLVLQGDWTDYLNLSVDTTWSNYFDSTGLIKNNVQNFVNEPYVTVLANYDCSLIPYFKDLNNTDMYIKTVINNETNATGLFCYI